MSSTTTDIRQNKDKALEVLKEQVTDIIYNIDIHQYSINICVDYCHDLFNDMNNFTISDDMYLVIIDNDNLYIN